MTIGPGKLVNLDEEMGGQPLRNYIREEWFEPYEENQT